MIRAVWYCGPVAHCSYSRYVSKNDKIIWLICQRQGECTILKWIVTWAQGKLSGDKWPPGSTVPMKMLCRVPYAKTPKKTKMKAKIKDKAKAQKGKAKAQTWWEDGLAPVASKWETPHLPSLGKGPTTPLPWASNATDVRASATPAVTAASPWCARNAAGLNAAQGVDQCTPGTLLR